MCSCCFALSFPAVHTVTAGFHQWEASAARSPGKSDSVNVDGRAGSYLELPTVLLAEVSERRSIFERADGLLELLNRTFDFVGFAEYCSEHLAFAPVR